MSLKNHLSGLPLASLQALSALSAKEFKILIGDVINIKKLNLDKVFIEELNLTKKAYNSLKSVGICTVSEISSMTMLDLVSIPGIGEVTALKIKNILRDFIESKTAKNAK